MRVEERTRAEWLATAATAAILASLATPALAQTEAAAEAEQAGLEEIVVTAQRREENLQEVPIAVSAVTAATLESTGIDTSRDLPLVIPSVQFTRSGASGLFFVRGVGTTNAAVGEEGANAVYIDNVYMADLGQTINNFNNVARIEVLKGPQGTLFGRNATGGLIHIITKEPGDKFEASGEVGIGNYTTVSGRAYVAGPLSENISADLAFTGLHQGQGWGRFLTIGRDDHIQRYWGLRSKIVLRAGENLKFVLAGDYYRNEDNLSIGWKLEPGTFGSAGQPGVAGYDTTSNDYALTKQKVWGVSLTGEADLGLATLTSITAYRKTRNQSDFDVDAGPLPLLRIAFDSGSKSFQQELRLASNDTSPFAWQLGAFYLHTEATNDSAFLGAALAAIRPTVNLATSTQTATGTRSQAILGNLKTNSYAAFGEASYEITPTTKVTGGIRFTADRRHFVGSQFSTLLTADAAALAAFPAGGGLIVPSSLLLTPDATPLSVPGVQDTRLAYDAVTWRVALRQELTPDISVYASVNKGFKSGSYSLQNPLNAAYLPQFILAYEAGLKSELFDRRLRVNVSYFHYDIDDYQVRSAAVASPGSSLILNAASAKVDGVELEFDAAPVERLRVFGGFTWLNSRFSKFGGPGSTFQSPIVYPQPATCPADLRGTRNPGVLTAGPRTGGLQTCFGDVSGNKTPNAPEWVTSLGASYSVPVGATGEVRLSGVWSYNSGFFFESDNVARQSSYHLVNASLEYRPIEKVGIELWVRNLTNTEYAVQKISTATGVATALGAPRTYGLNLKFDF
jgi:iron complex outermembrane recepter protein